MQQLPPPQVYLPYPLRLSLMQVPSYFSEPSCHTPLPNLSPFLNYPLQTDPLLQQQVPDPSGLPLEQVPSQRSPLLNSSSPFPCLYPFRISPLYSESADLMKPSPSGLLYFHDPEQNSSPDCHLPWPCFMPLTKLPWQMSPLAQMKMPFSSSGLLLTNLPTKTSPLMYSSPQPYLQLFWKYPSQKRVLLSLQTSSPQPWQSSLHTSPKQRLATLLQKSSFPNYLSWLPAICRRKSLGQLRKRSLLSSSFLRNYSISCFFLLSSCWSSRMWLSSMVPSGVAQPWFYQSIYNYYWQFPQLSTNCAISSNNRPPFAALYLLRSAFRWAQMCVGGCRGSAWWSRRGGEMVRYLYIGP